MLSKACIVIFKVKNQYPSDIMRFLIQTKSKHDSYQLCFLTMSEVYAQQTFEDKLLNEEDVMVILKTLPCPTFYEDSRCPCFKKHFMKQKSEKNGGQRHIRPL